MHDALHTGYFVYVSPSTLNNKVWLNEAKQKKKTKKKKNKNKKKHKRNVDKEYIPK